MLEIHGSRLSPFTRKVSLMAMELEIDYKFVDLNPHAPPPGFSELSPLAKVPVLRDGDFVLPDSSAIVGYLAASVASDTPAFRAIFPTDPKCFGRALWVEEYADTALFSDVSEGVFRPIFLRQWMGKAIDFATVEDAVANRLPKHFDYLEGLLGETTGCFGAKFSFADIAVYAQLRNLSLANKMPAATRYPKLIAWFEATGKRTVATKLDQIEDTFLAAALAALKRDG